MAYFIKSKYFDIKTLVDFSELDELIRQQEIALEFDENTDAPANDEFTANFQIFNKISDQIAENDNSTATTPSDETNEPEKTAVPEPQIKFTPPKPKPAIIDKKALQIKFISEKYEESLAAYFISVLLNPVVVSFGYRYDFSDSVNTSLGNLRLKTKADDSINENELENQDKTRQLKRNESAEIERKRELNKISEREELSFKQEISFQRTYKTKI